MAGRALQPGHQVEGGWAVQRHWIAMEEVGHDDEVAIGSQLVGNQLGIDEAVSDHVGQQENGALGGAVCGMGDVRLDCEVSAVMVRQLY